LAASAVARGAPLPVLAQRRVVVELASLLVLPLPQFLPQRPAAAGLADLGLPLPVSVEEVPEAVHRRSH
jgi:hypothetical protein